jgi:signal transduction histidine kinase
VTVPEVAPAAGGGVARRLRRLGLGQVLALSIGTLLVLAVAGIALALVAEQRLTDRRETVVERIDPARNSALVLERALLNQETGVRGYVLTGEVSFLGPFNAGMGEERAAYRELEALAGGEASTASRIRRVRAHSAAWRIGVVGEAFTRAREGLPPTEEAIRASGRRFERVRAAVADLQADLDARRTEAREDLVDTARALRFGLVLAGVMILGTLIGAGLVLRQAVTRPIGRLAAQTREVASGRFDTPIPPGDGAREIARLGDDVEAMRTRVVAELHAVESARADLQRQAAELERSNADLEQFAYVASHDLQEPLRKVLSFGELLERRYAGRLDERGDQYIGFMVDGARRMQALILDLLAFSRVGRRGTAWEPLDAGALVAQACAALSASIEEAGARVDVGDLPAVRGDRSLLVAVFQNLIGNAVKFRGPEPPVVRIRARRDGDMWRFCCADNGMGIPAEYADRVFVIFQRLHPRDAYEGTGIGLALCRKVVEHHGGRIWLDTGHPAGACFCFTLPDATEAERA